MSVPVEKEVRLVEINLDDSSGKNCRKILEQMYSPNNIFAHEYGTSKSVSLAVDDLYKSLWTNIRPSLWKAGLSSTSIEKVRRQILLAAYAEVFGQIRGEFDVSISWNTEVR